MKDNDKNKRKELVAKQKFHEDMVLGSKFIQNWYLFPTVPADGVEYAYDEFLRSVALFLNRRVGALEIQDLGISLFGASRYPCFDNILELGQPGFYGVINNVARIEKLTEEENKAFVGKIRKQHHIYKVKKSELIYKIAAASGEFYVSLSTVYSSFALLLNSKTEQNRKVNSVLDDHNLNRMILDREIFSALNFMDDFGGAMGYSGIGEDDFLRTTRNSRGPMVKRKTNQVIRVDLILAAKRRRHWRWMTRKRKILVQMALRKMISQKANLRMVKSEKRNHNLSINENPSFNGWDFFIKCGII
jgi:hypothetical protein